MAQKQRMSYFGEIRQRYNDPGFFNNNGNRPDVIDDIRRNVRRIIKDVANGNIVQEDYMYFQSAILLNICMEVCNENISMLNTETTALTYYINSVLMRNFQPNYVNGQSEHTNAAKLYAEASTKLGIWVAAKNCFEGIMRGYDAFQSLAPLIQLKPQINSNL